MRITFVLPYAGMSGGIRVIAIYAERLTRRGHDVTVVSTPPRVIPVRRKVKSWLLGNGWPQNARLEPSYFGGKDVTHRVIDRYRPITSDDVPDGDVVVATHWTTARWVETMPAEKGAKAIFIQGYEAVPGEIVPGLDAAWRMPFHKIVISQWLKDLASSRFGDDDVSHVPNSVDIRQFHAPTRGRQADPTVGVLYSTSGFKAFGLSSRAIEMARQTFPQLQVVSFGAEEPTADLPLPPGTDFSHRPAQDRIKNLYAQCDVWLCGSCREGFHLPPLEAMACRCPVVSTRVGGPMDIIQDGINGYLVDVGDAEALADRLVKVLTLSHERWKAMSDAAYATATRYTWDDATDLFEKALKKAIGRERQAEAATLSQLAPA